MSHEKRPDEPEILAFQAQCDEFYPPDAVSATIHQQREWYDALCRRFDAPRPTGLTTRDDRLGGVAVRRYEPSLRQRDMNVLYFHGGGFVVGSLESHDAICAELADACGLALIAVDYRLLPDNPHPAAFEDAFAVLEALSHEGNNGIIVAGDSAGGTIAAGLAIRARDAGIKSIAGQVLIYPGLGGDLSRGSFIEMADAPGLSTADVAYYRQLMAAPEDDPLAHPLKAETLHDLPPAFISAAHFDPLRDDARNYAARLAQAGVDVAFREEPQMVHAWLRARHMSPGAARGFAAIGEALRLLGRRAT